MWFYSRHLCQATPVVARLLVVLANQRSKGGQEMKEMRIVILGLLLVLGLASSGWTEAGTKIDLNSASPIQLETLPGVGPALAERIVQHRKENGSFKRIEELMNVKGIGEKKFLKFKDLVYVAQAAPKNTAKKN